MGILAFLIDELKKRDAVVPRQSHEKTAMTSPSQTAVLTWNVFGTQQVSTKIVVDLKFGMFDLHLAIRTDSEHSKCALSQYTSSHTPTIPITQNTQD